MISLISTAKVDLNKLGVSIQNSNEKRILLTYPEDYPIEFCELLETKQSDHAKVSLTLHIIAKLCECLNIKINTQQNSIILTFS